MVTSRIDYYDIAKFIAITLVLYGHCVQHLLSGMPYEKDVYLFIYSFHMQLFMLISGIFARRSVNQPFPKFLANKLERIVLPCVTWGG